MVYDLKDDVIKIFIPTDFGLYNQEFSPFLENINSTLDSLKKSKNSKIICFLQTGPNTDVNQNLYDQLYHDVTFDDVYEKLILVRRTLSRLKDQNLTTVFSSFFDCHGSVFELFLNCDYRLNFDEYCYYGFEEIIGDFFPCGGAFEDLMEQKSPAVARIKSTGSILAKEAAKLGLIHFSINGDDHFGLTDSWLANNMSTLKSRPERSNTSRGLKDSSDNIGRLTLDKLKIQKLKIDLTTDYCFQNRTPRALTFCENLLQTKTKNLAYSEMKSLITYMSARYTLSPRFKSWFKSRLNSNIRLHRSAGSSSIVPVFSVYPYVPPAQPLLNALTSGQSLIFYSSSSTHLKNGLDLFTGRLEQQLGREKSLKILRNQINWLLASEQMLSGYQVVFEANSQFSVRKKDKYYKFYHTLNSKIDHDDILAEYPTSIDSPLPSKIRALIETFCTGVFETQPFFSQPVPIITLARSLLLQEIARLAELYNENIEFVLESLKISGWRFASESSSWERFVRGRQAFLELPDSELRAFVVPIDPDLWQLGLWKEVRSKIKFQGKSGLSAPSATFVSRHLMAYICYIVGKISEIDNSLSAERMDLLISSALGVPDNYGTTERYRYMWGPKRLNQYIQHHWDN